jgi:hypothetical protein
MFTAQLPVAYNKLIKSFIQRFKLLNPQPLAMRYIPAVLSNGAFRPCPTENKLATRFICSSRRCSIISGGTHRFSRRACAQTNAENMTAAPRTYGLERIRRTALKTSKIG